MIYCPRCSSEIPAGGPGVPAGKVTCHNCGEAFKVKDSAEEVIYYDCQNPPKHVRILNGGAVCFKRIPWIITIFLVLFLAVSGIMVYAVAADLMGKMGVRAEMLFLFPFLLGGLVVLVAIFYMLFGRMVFAVRDDALSIFYGVGGIGVSRRYPVSEIEKVRVEVSRIQVNHRAFDEVVLFLKSGERAGAGRFMSPRAQIFIAGYLQRKLDELK